MNANINVKFENKIILSCENYYIKINKYCLYFKKIYVLIFNF
jgi:hypothetical protein